MDKNKVFGILTFSVLIGGTAYAIYKYKKTSTDNEEVWTVADAKREVERVKAEREEAGIYEPLTKEEREEALLDDEHFDFIESINASEEISDGTTGISGLEELQDGARDEASWNSSFYPKPNKNYFELEENKLRHDHNSNEALDQFIKMELADWDINDYSRARMFDLFSFPILTNNEGDLRTISQISDYRSEFFGPESRWNDDITMADIILHYARATDYNYGNGVRYWVEHFLETSGLDDEETPSGVKAIIDEMNNHSYYNSAMEVYSLFGVDDEQASRIMEIAAGGINGLVSYDIEYNVFLEGL